MVDTDTILEGLDRPSRKREPRFVFLVVLLIGTMGLIVGRSFYLQIVEGRRFQLQAEENRVAVELLPAPRGIIYDRNGKQLLSNVASTDVLLDPLLLPAPEHEAPLFDNLPLLIPITPDELRARVIKVRENEQPVLLYRALAHDEAIALASALDTVPGVRLVSSSVRSYLLAQPMASVLGYTGLADPAELRDRPNLLITDTTGKAGIEKYYDTTLRGSHGAAYREVDAAQRPQKDLGEQPAVAGADLALTIDSDLQEYIYQLLESREAARRDLESDWPEEVNREEPTVGAVVVLDPTTGALRALVSYPAFDPNAFSQPILRDQTQSILTDSRKPLFNRAIAGTYAPGSTIKPLLAAAGLEDGLISPQTTWLSNGGLRIGEWYFPDWKAGGHGQTTVTKALAESVNTFFYLLAGGDETRRGLGVDAIASYLAAFSWGGPTGVDLPGEEGGLLPNPVWKEQVKGERWYIGDTYHVGIGQGDLLVTPLQVAVATAALANDGTVYAPHVLQEQRLVDGNVVSFEGQEKRLPIARQNLQIVRQGMREAVTEGSARRLASLPVAVAGKTGTAQIGGTEHTNAWFTSFGPYENPKLVVTVLLERAGGGDRAAAPLAQDIWQWWAENR